MDLFEIGLAKYSPDQPRDDDGRWTDDGGSSDTHPAIHDLNQAARAVRADNPESAEHFLNAARGFVADVKAGRIEPSATTWKEALSPAGKVLQRLAGSTELLAIPAGVGVAVGTLAGAAMGSRLIGFRVGAALAGVLAVAMIYDSWANNHQSVRTRDEARRLRENMQDLEHAFAQFKAQHHD